MSDECLNIILYYSESIKQYFLEAVQYNNGEDNFSPDCVLVIITAQCLGYP